MRKADSDSIQGRSHRPLVSIIVPSFNQGAFIRDTIESCLAQDYRPLEVIVVDGASKDQTVKILHEYDQVAEVRWISEPDSGVVEAVNKGFALANGEIAGIQSSDDAYLPGAVSEALRVFQQFPQLGLVYGDSIYVDTEGKEIKRHITGPYSLENFLSGSTFVSQPAAFFKLAIARQVGGWNPKYFVADTEMWLRMLFRTEAKKVDAFWGKRRIHEQQRNSQVAKIVSSYHSMIDDSSDIRVATKSLQQAAKCGKHMIAAGYNPSGSPIVRYYHHLRAILAFPAVRKNTSIASGLVPGYWFFRRYSTKLRRAGGKAKRVLLRCQ